MKLGGPSLQFSIKTTNLSRGNKSCRQDQKIIFHTVKTNEQLNIKTKKFSVPFIISKN